ncbi:MAG: hypothetical protein IGNPGNKH_00518 [Sodalis sp. Ffu]|nr:MAG: hypothetical protein IGNPGNKH_00518 [Sodalis sp. Ffu]
MSLCAMHHRARTDFLLGDKIAKVRDAGQLVSFYAMQELVIESKVVAYITIALMACFVVTLAEIALLVMRY